MSANNGSVCAHHPRTRTRIPALPFCYVRLSGQIPRPKGYPTEPKTLGEHLLKRRLDLGLLQREAASQIGVTEATIWNWENGGAVPDLRRLPGVIRFLRYDPRPKPETIGRSLHSYRRARGMSQRALAQVLAVDPSTLAGWEHGRRVPAGRFLARVQTVLEASADWEPRE